ncbi:TRADD-N-associated membrane domain-containing protein [Streptomyces sp. MK7]|uniref:TRADD-N-associated membrane domain-containing protein n=1 Tax=Streptomyces sp. MK7 TaxID=3067635 RepID=UPI00292D61E0|nr:hypothetical protein [Streptomyces sp. MK7]
MDFAGLVSTATGMVISGASLAFAVYGFVRRQRVEFEDGLAEERKRINATLERSHARGWVEAAGENSVVAAGEGSVVTGEHAVITEAPTERSKVHIFTEQVDPQSAARRHIEDERFAELLGEYYAYGLAQAKSSFVASQRFAGLGTSILLLGIALAVWRTETTGDLYLGIVTSSVGVVTTLIGQLFHRRADIALRHMADQTGSLREDMRRERATDQALLLLSHMDDKETKARLQAGLIMKLADSSMPSLSDGTMVISETYTDTDGAHS